MLISLFVIFIFQIKGLLQLTHNSGSTPKWRQHCLNDTGCSFLFFSLQVEKEGRWQRRTEFIGFCKKFQQHKELKAFICVCRYGYINTKKIKRKVKTQHSKAIIFQLKKNSFRFTEKLRRQYKRAPTVYHTQFLYC